nr:arsenate reductase (glutaredoxin) [Roseovarius aestuariivivens]
MTVIWHNPRCSKSRQTLALLQEKGVEPEVRKYLEDAPDEAELREAAEKLGLGVSGMMRRGEKAWKELGLSEHDPDDRLISAMAEHPILIERPIVFAKDRAAIGRPPEAVLDIL